MAQWKQAFRKKWAAWSGRPFALLLRLFIGRAFHGAGDSGSAEMDVSAGVILILLAMPGVLVSLLMFEKYGSLIRYLRGDGVFDPYAATIPDEYFFIVLSMVVTGLAALWRWEALFLDRRDYVNIVPLPVSLGKIFFGNLAAILAFVGALTIDVNAVSFVLFPLAVLGSQNSFAMLIRFGAGHAIAVVLASTFSFLAVFALIGFLMAVLPHRLFRSISMYVRFAIALFLLALLATSFAVPPLLSRMQLGNVGGAALLPPLWFLGVCQTVWGRGDDLFFAAMTKVAVLAVGISLLIATLAYTLSFRRFFVRIPETADIGPLPRAQSHHLPGRLFEKAILRDAPQRGSFHFIAQTLLRSDTHLQIVMGFIAVGLIVSAQSVASALDAGGVQSLRTPSVGLLSIPFILGFCVVAGIRLAFAIPSDLRSNWVFKLWLDRDNVQPRSIARKALFTFCLGPLIPSCFVYSMILWGTTVAILHTVIFTISICALAELLLLRFRKIPFTSSYPTFQSHSPLIIVMYLFGFLIFTTYIPQMDLWSLADPWRAFWFVPLLAGELVSVYQYRKQMLEMDKQLIFQDSLVTGF